MISISMTLLSEFPETRTMAWASILLPISLILIFSVNANPINLGSSLSPTNTSNWVSPSGIFAFGFYPHKNNTTTNKTAFGVGIQMLTQPQPTIVWTTATNPLFSPDATMVLTESALVVEDGGGNVTELISFISDDESNITISAAMLDSGNFVVFGNDSSGSDDGDNGVVWQSFDYPSDTILVDQKLRTPDKLVSRETGFELVMQDDDNLVLYAPNSGDVAEHAYWASDTYASGYKQLCLNSTGSMYLASDRERSTHILANGTAAGGDKMSIYRATLDVEGFFRLYKHDILTSADDERRPAAGVEIWSIPGERCEVKGACGFNSFCTNISGPSLPGCLCYPGFIFNDANDFRSGCYRNYTEPSCGASDYNQDVYSIENVTFQDNSYSVKPAKGIEICVKSCLEDCSCWVALYSATNCSKYKRPLRYGRTINNGNVTSIGLFKVVLNSTNQNMNTHPTPEVIKIEAKKTPILILASVFGSVVFLSFTLAATSLIIYRRRVRSYKRVFENVNTGLSHEDNFTLRPFSYEELKKATDDFGEELGRGSFGAVYKGSINGIAIAVKRLERVKEEGVREFQAEMTSIGRTHHRNLVQLLGFCIEGSKRLLVYEFMSNGSLASLLFDSTAHCPDWRKRVKFALDVARGLYYLHEECRVHIIHCNLKPWNVLLDDTWTAKISDFGFARLLAPDQAELNTGYFAPEWQKNALISVKCDIYSFGIMLFEIVCCRRSIELDVESPSEIVLSTWVYECFVGGELAKLVVADENVEKRTLERMVKVGLWCVQDDPTLRPAMKNVMLMLEGTMDIPLPPPPQLPLVSL